MSRITINGVSVDPLAQGQLMAAAGIEAPDASRSNYILVQTAAPLTEEQKAQLAGLGVEIQEYVPDEHVPVPVRPDRPRADPRAAVRDVGRRLPEGFQDPADRSSRPRADPATAIVPDLT